MTNRRGIQRFSAALASIVLLGTPGVRAGANGVKGTVVTAQSTRAKSVLIWDASARVAELSAAKMVPQDARAVLEAEAVRLLGERAKAARGARTEVRVVYILSRLSASYGNPAAADRGTLFVVSAARADALRAAAWAAQVRGGRIPRGLTLTVVSEFPAAY